MSDNDEELLILNGKRYLKQSRWCRDKKITTRTAARHRQQGLPWLDWAGEVYSPEREGDAYIAGRVKRRNPPRNPSRRPATAEVRT
jgi:hypothetical protein